MAVLSDFMADIYAALPTFNRELTGFIPAVNVDAQLTGASVNDTVKVPLVQVAAPAEYKQQMGIPTPGVTSQDYVELKMDKASYVSFPLAGEVEAGLKFSGAGTTVTQQRFESAFRQLANEMEAYLADKLVKGASRAVGKVGTTPFGKAGNLEDVAIRRRFHFALRGQVARRQNPRAHGLRIQHQRTLVVALHPLLRRQHVKRKAARNDFRPGGRRFD